MSRCSWASQDPILTYHDIEHGRLTNNYFEMLTLEIFQPGLSFNIVLQKRSGLKEVFKNYNLIDIAKMDKRDVDKALCNPNIIRHKKKIEAIINNAQIIQTRNIDLEQYIFDNVDYTNGLEQTGVLLAAQFKKDGFKFVGPSVAKSLLEALGLLPAHEKQCSLANFSINEYVYHSTIGYIVIKYQNYNIIESKLSSDALVTIPNNAFESLLKYHLDNYFNHKVYNFKFLLSFNAPEFTKLVYDVVRHIPCGSTLTYADVAHTINSHAYRAVGSSLKKSNHFLFLPAHRVVATNGLGGFQGELALKQKMLDFEK